VTPRISTLLVLAMFLGGFRSPASAQGLREAPESERNKPPPSEIFGELQGNLLSGEATAFSEHLGKQVYLNLSDRESGFFSQNQALYILKDYLKARRIISFKFTTISEVEGTPFATGGGTYLHRGNPEILQIYVSLKKSGDRWVIAQFSVF
jgi:uncharacterized protein DUF4783